MNLLALLDMRKLVELPSIFIFPDHCVLPTLDTSMADEILPYSSAGVYISVNFKCIGVCCVYESENKQINSNV